MLRSVQHQPIATQQVTITPTTVKQNQSFSTQLSDNVYVRGTEPIGEALSQRACTCTHETVSTPAKGLMNKVGGAIKKLAEVADRINKIRNAIEGFYKLVGAIWPVFYYCGPTEFDLFALSASKCFDRLSPNGTSVTTRSQIPAD